MGSAAAVGVKALVPRASQSSANLVRQEPAPLAERPFRVILASCFAKQRPA